MCARLYTTAANPTFLLPCVLPQVYDSFLKAHGLSAGHGVTRASALVGTALTACEEVNYTKLAIR